MQHNLSAEPYTDLKLKKLVDTCIAMETASKNAQRLQETKPVEPVVNAVYHTSDKQQRHKKLTGSKKVYVNAVGARTNQMNAASKKLNIIFVTKQGILLQYLAAKRQKEGQKNKDTNHVTEVVRKCTTW